jgi:glycosyltransferase involved in cell wall biosynthesis
MTGRATTNQAASGDGLAPSKPLVSVVIPTYNRAARLQACLRSVTDAEPDAEVIVVDDGSTDHTGDVVAAFPRVHYIRQANRGPSAARNTGIRESHGRYIALFDSDDRMLRGARPLIPALLDRQPEVGVVFTNAFVAHDDGTQERAYDPAHPEMDTLWAVPHELSPDGARVFARAPMLRSLVLDRCYVIPSISIIRRSALDECGAFDESLIGYEEWDLFSRLAARYAFAYFDEPSATIVKHDSNLSGDLEAMVVQGVTILRRFVNGALPLDANTRAAATKKLEWLSLDTARHAFVREDYATARTRVVAHMKQWGPSAGALVLWSATWLRPAQVRRLRAWKTRMIHEPVR